LGANNGTLTVTQRLKRSARQESELAL